MKTLTILILLSFSFTTFGQDTISQKPEKSPDSYGIRIIPSIKANIYGIAIGPFGGDVLCYDSVIKNTHGINVQLLGQGIFTPFAREELSFNRMLKSDSSVLVNYPKKGSRIAIHNGLLVSLFGTWTHTVNGISISALSSIGHKMNGVSFNLLQSKYGVVNGLSFAVFNQSNTYRGIQLGMINKTVTLRGFQFGLWNVNEKRKLPLVNWQFKD